MRKKSHECRIVLLAVSLVLAAFKANAQLGIPPLVSALPEEAPASLFSTSIGDSDVELFVQGFWEASILSSGSFSFGGPTAGAFNATPFLFIQRPDLYLLLVFRKQWWLEASVADDIERATWAIGYSGEEDDFIEFVRLGNTGILMPDYPYIALGAPEDAFGAVVSGRDESKGTAFDAMLRWDGLSWRSRSFSGLAETVETTVRPRDQLRGRRFVLPDEGLSSIALFDHTSGGKRLLQADEYAVSLSKGFVELKAEPQGLLSVIYSVGENPPVPELGLYKQDGIEVVGTVAIGDIGQSSEARNLYALSDSPSRRELFVRNLTSGLTDTGFEVREAGPGLIEVMRAGTSGPRPDSSTYKRPFSVAAAGLTPDPDDDGQDWIYEDDTDVFQDKLYPSTEGYSIVARSIETVDAIVLGSEAVPGTVTVFRDGVQSEAYEFDSTDGSLELYPPPRSGESILVHYAVTSADRSDGALVFAAGTRFPWLGMDWALALGGRWSLPGVAYASGGELKPAWTGLAIGVEHREPGFGIGAKAIGKYTRASANGLYRLAGMEDAPAYSSPFRPVSGDITGFDIDTVLDTALATDFPETLGKIHTQNESNRVLSIQPNNSVSGEIELLRYIDPSPMASFGRLSFFILVQDVLLDANLELQVGIGEGGAGGLTVELPVHELSQEGWLKVEVELDPVNHEVRIFSPGGQSLTLTPAPSAAFEPVTTVGEIRMFISGLTEGTVFIDEIVLEEPEDGLSAILTMDFSLGQAESARPPYLGIKLTGVADEKLSVGGSLHTGWILGPSEWALSMAPVWSENYESAALGYVLAVPDRSSATRFVDQYSQDIASRSFSRNISAALGVDSLRLGLEAGSGEVVDRFSQNWKGSASWGTIAGFGIELAMVVPETLTAELAPADVWLESWHLLLPAMESAASSRRLKLSASFIESRLLMDYSQDYSAPGTIATNAGARTRLPFTVDVFGFEPFLERRYKVSESGAVSGFSEDFDFALERAGAMSQPFMAVPILDLFMDDLRSRFVDSASGSDSASYTTGAGFLANRPIGYGLPDLFVPNTLEFKWTRTFESTLDSQADYQDFMVKITTAAVNLFGYGGAKPLIEELTFDEYSSDIEASARYHSVDGALLPSLSARHAANTETRSGATIGAESRFSWKRTRTGNQTSEALSLSLGKRPVHTWLGDLVALIFVKRSAVAEPDSEDSTDSEEEDNSVSQWFDSITMESAVLRDSFDATLLVSGQELPGSNDLKASFEYATRMIIPGSLSVGFHASINQSAGFRTDGTVWGFGYELGIDGRVSF